MDYRDIITLGVGGKSRVRHLEVSVTDVLERLASGLTEAEVREQVPDLTSEDVRACVAFANDQIRSVRDIAAEKPSVEVWKYLRFFLDVPATAEMIHQLHGVPAGTHTKNITKQAQQIGFCIRQAEQYFMASAQVGLPTRPVLLYYGALGLSQALILLKKDGTFSLDARRKDRRHNHHGLELKRGFADDAVHTETPQGFLEKVECYCHSHNGAPWGHFPLFYKSLAPPATTTRAEIFITGKSGSLLRDYPLNCADLPTLDSIAGRRLNAWELLKGLPDLHFSLAELGTWSNLCRGNMKRQIRHLVLPAAPLSPGPGDSQQPHGQSAQVGRVQFVDSFFVDGIAPAQKEGCGGLWVEFFHVTHR